MSLIRRYNPQVQPSGIEPQQIIPTHPAIQVVNSALKTLEAFHEDQVRQDIINRVSDLKDKARTIRESEMSRMGPDAYGGVDRASGELEKIAKKHLEEIDPEHREAFLRYAAAVRDSLLDSIATHEVGQRKVALDGSVNNTVQTSMNDVYENPGNLERNLKEVEDQLQFLGIPRGIGYYRNAKNKIKQAALDGIIDADPDAAKMFLAQNKGLFDEQTIKKANKAILENEKTKLYLQRQEEKKAQEATANDFIIHLDTLTPKQVRESNLPATGEGSKEHFLDLIKKRDAPGKSAYDITTGSVLAHLLERQNDPTKPPLSPTEIMSYVGKGLSAKDAQKLISSTDLTKNPVFKTVDMSLKSNFGYEGFLKGFGNKQQGAIFYSRAISDIIEHFKEGRITTNNAKQMQKEIFSIAAPYITEYMKTTGATEAEIKERLATEGVATGAMGNILDGNPKHKLVFRDGRWQ